MFDFDKVVEMINNYLEDEGEEENVYFNGGVDEDKIKQAEKTLSVPFSESYIAFLKRYGSGGIGCADFMGIESTTEDSSKFTVVNITQYFRDKAELPESLVVIENCGDYVVCLDTSQMHNGECPVVTFGLYDSDGKVECSDNFFDYILEKLDDALN